MNNLPAKMKRLELVKDLLLHHFSEEAIAKKLKVAIEQVRRDNLKIRDTQDKDILQQVANNLVNMITSASFFRTKELYDVLQDVTSTTNQKMKALEIMRAEEDHWINICEKLGYVAGKSDKPLIHLHQQILNVGGGQEQPDIDEEGKPALGEMGKEIGKLSPLDREDIRLLLEKKIKQLKNSNIVDATVVETDKDV